ncbi:hypothetical protein OIO90_002204 [Microbotryomycetes sp. JL221]|nr:hypothetical protein OIO90_002204 [Microbotryomycetes sp. JL221]
MASQPPQYPTQQPPSRPVGRPRIQKRVPPIMYGFGDTDPREDTVKVMEEILIEHITDVCHQAQRASSSRGKLKVDDFKFALRHDDKKLARINELLFMNEVISRARGRDDMTQYADEQDLRKQQPPTNNNNNTATTTTDNNLVINAATATAAAEALAAKQKQDKQDKQEREAEKKRKRKQAKLSLENQPNTDETTMKPKKPKKPKDPNAPSKPKKSKKQQDQDPEAGSSSGLGTTPLATTLGFDSSAIGSNNGSSVNTPLP